MNDTDIIDLFWARSESAIEELSRKYDKLARSVAMNILRDAQDADECMNDSYLGMWNSLPPHRPNVLPAFFTALTRNNALKRVRYKTAEKRTVLMAELTEFSGSTPSPEEEIDGAAFVISRYLAELDRTSRVLFMRRYYLGESVREAAEAVGLSENAAAVRLSRIRKRLKKRLEKEGITV